MTTYSELAPKLKTGDVLLFSATFAESLIIKQLTGSAYSHSGMVCRFPKKDDKVYLWEAVDESRTFVDPIDDLQHVGARVVELEPLLAYYTPFTGNQFTWRKLNVQWTEHLQEAFESFVKRIDTTPFPPETTMLVNYILGHYRNISTGNAVMYCAQLVAATYQSLQLLPLDPPTNYYAPADFSQAGQTLPMLEGAFLGPEVVVTFDGTPVANPVSVAATKAAASTGSTPAVGTASAASS